MKKIMIISLLAMFAFSYDNPYGKPFTLHLGLTSVELGYDLQDSHLITRMLDELWENSEISTSDWQRHKTGSKNYFKIDLTMPVNSWLTLQGGIIDGKNNYAGVELHLPMYNVWEN